MSREPRHNTQYHAQSIEAVAESLATDPDRGLSRTESTRRLESYGLNSLPSPDHVSTTQLLLNQFRSMVVYILLAAGGLAVLTGRWPEAFAVLAVVLVNTSIGFTSEWRARISMRALRRMQKCQARTLRDGREAMTHVEELVPGDVVLLEDGDIAPADIRLTEANSMRVDESMLTGESVSVIKQTDPAPAGAPLVDRACMIYRGTTVTEGSGRGIITSTGSSTELGKIADLVGQAEQRGSPVRERLNQLGGRLAWITLGIAVLVAAGGLYAGQPTVLMVETAIALGVAAIPEGLPIVATIALAHGMWRMAKRKAIVNRLPAVETLGSTTVILTDKTGTVTENRMQLSRAVTADQDHRLDSGKQMLDGHPVLKRLIEVGVLCNNATLRDDNDDGVPEERLGDPTELALLLAGLNQGIKREQLLDEYPEVREVAFDPEQMRMATIHEMADNDYLVAVKGAPSAVIECSVTVAQDEGRKALDDQQTSGWLKYAEELADAGLRVLAIADKQADSADTEPYTDLRLLGLVGLADPPREGIEDAVIACRKAGIQVVMVTGDQPATARAIAHEVGIEASPDNGKATIVGSDLDDDRFWQRHRDELADISIFARVNPDQKLRLVELFQDRGHVAAMTGDGVNDTPALRQADIGVAMGQRGTDAAREAADMVLKDDAFGTIVTAVHRGRVIFDNIRRSAVFMLCTNGAEVFAVASASIIGLPPPLRPLQILYLNVITDVFPALALSIVAGDPGVMDRPPRDPTEKILTGRHWGQIAGWSVLIGLTTLASLVIARSWLGLDPLSAVTASFMTLAIAKLWFVFNLRSPRSTFWDNGVTRSPWVWASLLLCIVLLLLAVYLPGLSGFLETKRLGPAGWTLTLVASLIPLIIGQIILWIRGGRNSNPPPPGGSS